MRVLFIGNSHTYFNDMPHTFAGMVQSLTGARPEVTMLAYSDRDLAWHREEYFAVRFALLYGNYDYCVLQQQANPTRRSRPPSKTRSGSSVCAKRRGRSPWST